MRPTHRDSGSKEFWTWWRMKQRCYYPSGRFKDYGGRGIKVCKRWINSYENFLADMGRAPSPQHSLDRKKNDGNYTPKNCRWATREEQQANRRNSVTFTHVGLTRSLFYWSKHFGIANSTIRRRIKAGWTIEKAVLTKADEKFKNKK
jgi:hypothetical protein